MAAALSDADWERLRVTAVEAMERAYAPYSSFPVGVAGLADDLDVGAVGQRVADAAADQRVVVDDQVAVAPACVFPAGHGACMRPPRPLL